MFITRGILVIFLSCLFQLKTLTIVFYIKFTDLSRFTTSTLETAEPDGQSILSCRGQLGFPLLTRLLSCLSPVTALTRPLPLFTVLQ